MSSTPPTGVGAVQSVMATMRPWQQFLDLSSFNIPVSFTESTARIKRNLFYFRVNYAFFLLLILFSSLLWHPISMIVFLIIFVAWFFLYFFRNEPLSIFNWTVDDRIVLAVLGLTTVIALILTHVWVNVLVSFVIGGVLVTLHGAFRSTEDLTGDDQESPYNALLSVVDDPQGTYSPF